jgi:hypothetical protein
MLKKLPNSNLLGQWSLGQIAFPLLEKWVEGEIIGSIPNRCMSFGYL